LGPHGETHRQIAAEVGGGKTLGQAVAAGLAIEKSFIGRGDDGRADGDGCRAARGVEKKTASAVVIGVFVDIIIVFTDDVVTDVILTDVVFADVVVLTEAIRGEMPTSISKHPQWTVG
jgi:hypothetical protein